MITARLGLPDLKGRRPLAAALVIDSLGDGLFLPFAVVYFLHATGLSLAQVGFGLSAASLLALPAAPVCGVLIDRFSPAAIVVGGNLISAAAFAGYLLVSDLPELILFAFFAAAGGRFFWTANLALVGETFEGAERTRWFAFQRAARNGGYGLGGLLAAAALGSGSGLGYRALVLANAATFLAAAVLVRTWSRRQPPRSPVRRASGPGGFRVPLSDRPFLILTAMNVLFVLCMMVLDVLLAVYLVRVLRAPVWVSGVLFATNTVAVAAAQTAVWSLLANRRPVRVLQLSAAVWGTSFLLMWLTAALPHQLAIPGVFVAVVVFTIAELIQGPVFNGLVAAAAPDHLRGRYMAVYQLSWALAQAMAPGLFGLLFTTSHALPWITLAAGCAACVVILAKTGGPALRRE